MNYYSYNSIEPLGSETLGTEGRMITRDLKTLRGVINRIPSNWYKKGFSIYKFTNFYRDNTFTLVHSVKPKSN